MSFPTVFNHPAEGVMLASVVVLAMPVKSVKQYACTTFGALTSIVTSILWCDLLAFGHIDSYPVSDPRLWQGLGLFALLLASAIGIVSTATVGAHWLLPGLRRIQFRSAVTLTALLTVVACGYLVISEQADNVGAVSWSDPSGPGPNIIPMDLIPAPFGYGATGVAGLLVVFLYQVSLAWGLERILMRNT